MLISAHDGYPRWARAGADFLEIDVRRRADGVFILSHDEPAAAAITPTLDEALHSGCAVQLDLKEDGFEEEVIRLALEHLPADKIVVTTGAEDSIKAVKDMFPHVRAGLTLAEEPDDATWRRVERCHSDFVAVDHRYARWFATSAMPVWLWTVDDRRLLRRWLAAGWPDALITNRPDVALRLRAKRGQNGTC